jgi:hypothetical protein
MAEEKETIAIKFQGLAWTNTGLFQFPNSSIPKFMISLVRSHFLNR